MAVNDATLTLGCKLPTCCYGHTDAVRAERW